MANPIFTTTFILSCTILITAQSRLIDHYLADQMPNEPVAWHRRRLPGELVQEISHFGDSNAHFSGVALLLYYSFMESEYLPRCSGALIKNPPDASSNHFVVTAAHCVYNRARKEFSKELDRMRVEFGVHGSESAAQCEVEDVRVNPNWIIVSDAERYQYDYAVLKLRDTPDCKPTHAFILSPTVGHKELVLDRAGYTAGRTLTVHAHEQVPKDDVSADLMYSVGCSENGDSGGPYFVKGTHKLKAIHSGCRGKSSAKQRRAVKITESVETNIHRYIMGEDGISSESERCEEDEFHVTECWSYCEKEKPKSCFATDTESRDYARFDRWRACSGVSGYIEWLCGPATKVTKPKQDSAYSALYNLLVSYVDNDSFYDDDY